MRFLVRATIPVETGNDMIRSGPEMDALLQKVLGEVRPEAVYFCAENGHRTLYLVVDMTDASELPRIAEPFWLSLSCDVEFIPAMTQADFAKAATHIASAASKF
jgi:hypothetical protein